MACNVIPEIGKQRSGQCDAPSEKIPHHLELRFHFLSENGLGEVSINIKMLKCFGGDDGLLDN